MHLRVLRSASCCSYNRRAAQHLASRPVLAFSATQNGEILSCPLMELDLSPTSAFHSNSITCGTPATWQEEPCSEPTKPDWAEKRPTPVNKVQKIVDDISSLTLVEVSELNLLLKKRFCLHHVETLPLDMGIMPGAWVPGMQFGSFNRQPAKAKEKGLFTVKIDKYDAASKTRVVKQVRAFTLLGLKEARELLRKTPALVRGGMSKEEAQEMIEKLRDVGATAFIE